MSSQEVENELSHWFSTYGVITSERILGTYKIKLSSSELVTGIKNPLSFFHRLLQIPLRNVLTGIVLQQANDYHVYVQKLFIDYLLSNESAKGEDDQGSLGRESMEEERQQLLSLGDEFQKIQDKHNSIISASQRILIKVTKEFNTELEKAIKSLNVVLNKIGFRGKKSHIREAINHALIYFDVSNPSPNSKSHFVTKMNELLQVNLTEESKNQMTGLLSRMFEINLGLDKDVNHFLDDVQELSLLANSFRTQFYETVLRVLDLIKSLPDYKIDPDQDAINREPLYFDRSIGTTEK